MTSIRKDKNRPHPHCLPAALVLLLGAVLVTGTENGAIANPVIKAVPEKVRQRRLEELAERMQSQEIRGSSKDDWIVTYYGDDRILAGGGNDIVSSGGGDDEVHGGDGDDRLYGGSGNDRLYGDNGNDLLMGGSGNDLLKGERGNDFLHGGSGDDVLHTRWGHDWLVGGTDDDTFVVCASGQPEMNVILDFTPGEDVIDLRHPGIHVVDFADLLSLANQTSQGVQISLPTNNPVNDRLVLIGLTIADLDPADFDI